jgi:hypothetical protein
MIPTTKAIRRSEASYALNLADLRAYFVGPGPGWDPSGCVLTRCIYNLAIEEVKVIRAASLPVPCGLFLVMQVV